jgi:hypothetical protein
VPSTSSSSSPYACVLHVPAAGLRATENSDTEILTFTRANSYSVQARTHVFQRVDTLQTSKAGTDASVGTSWVTM